MDINIVTELFHPHIGGQETRYRRLGKELSSQGFSVNLYTIRLSNSLPVKEEIDGITVYRLFEIPNYIHNYRRTARGLLAYTKTLHDFLHSSRGLKNVIINQMPILPILLNCPQIKHIDAIIDWAEYWANNFFFPFFRKLAKCTNRHIVINPEIYQFLLRNGLSNNQICYIPPAIDLKKYQCDVDNKKHDQILYVGRLVKHKNVDMLIKAFSYVSKRATDTRLFIIGDGPEKEYLKRLTYSLNIHDKVLFKSHLSDSALISLLKESYLLVLPSSREGFSWVILESMAAGTPVITVDYLNNYGAKVVRKSEGGVVCKPTYIGIAKAILHLLSNSEKWFSLHKNAIEYSMYHDIKLITKKLARFLSL